MQRLVGLVFLSVGVCAGLLVVMVSVIIIIKGVSSIGVLLLLGPLFLVASVLYVAYIFMKGTAPKVERPPAWVGNFLIGIPEARELDDRRYQVLYRPAAKGKKGRPSTLTVSVPAVTPAALQFTKETWFDRWSKRWCIAREVQTYDPEFDDLVYIRGRSDAYARRFLSDDAKRQAIVSLLGQDFGQVRLTGTHVESTWSGFDPESDDRPDLTDLTAGALFTLAESLPKREKVIYPHVGIGT